MINNTFKYPFSYIKIKIKNERNDNIIMKKKKKIENTHERNWVDMYNNFEVGFIQKMKSSI